MSSRFRQVSRKLLVAAGLLLVAGWLVPQFLSAERFRARLEAELSRAFARPTSFGAVSFRLIPRPGFSLENVVVREDPSFGVEPFVRVDRIDGDIRWRGLWRRRLELARLRLERPSFNIVRSERGNWNVETLLRGQGMASPAGASVDGGGAAGGLDLETDNGRLDFKLGENKKPFAITDLRARLTLDPARRHVSFRLVGSPVRTDLSLPTPGAMELTGEWTADEDLEGALNATLRTERALLYDWIPLLTGHNPEIYGVLDAEVRLAGTIRVIKVEGQASLRQLHRWEQLPPSDLMPCAFYFRGQVDRARGRIIFDSVEASFADSQVHLTGSIEKIASSPELDLVVALERSRLEDLVKLGGRLLGSSRSLGIAGRVDGLLTVQGPWGDRRYGGFVGVREASLAAIPGRFDFPEIDIRIDSRGVHLTPVRLALAPHLELVAEGFVRGPAAEIPRRRRAGGRILPGAAAAPQYELNLSAKGAPLAGLVNLARAVGFRAAPGVDARGSATLNFRLAGTAWPPAPPTVTGRVDLRAARLLIPGLTEPLNIPRARIQVQGDRIIAEPVVAVIGTSVFTGKLEHRGERKQPWTFDVGANTLRIDEGALWFDALGYRAPLPLLERLPGIKSLLARRTAASSLFTSVNARGQFAAPTVTYRSLALEDFRTFVEISGRVVRLSGTTFRAGGGRAQGGAEVDLTSSPARVTADVRLAGASLQSLAARFPPALKKVRGTVSGSGHFETRGLTRFEMAANLFGHANLGLRNLAFGDFDPLEALAQATESGSLEPRTVLVRGEPAREEAFVPSAALNLEVRDRHVVLREQQIELGRTRLNLNGSYAFDGTMELDVSADLRRVARRESNAEGSNAPNVRPPRVHISGPLDRLTVVPDFQVSRITP